MAFSDESPTIGGPFGPYRQSERKDFYSKMIDDLIDKGDAYYAFDKTNELDELRKASEKSGETFIYNWENRMNFKNSLHYQKMSQKVILIKEIM